MYVFIYSKLTIFGALCTRHWFRPKEYSGELDKVLNIMKFTEIVINQI